MSIAWVAATSICLTAAPAPARDPERNACSGVEFDDSVDFCHKTDQHGEVEISKAFGTIFQVDTNLASCKDIFREPVIHEALDAVVRHRSPLKPGEYWRHAPQPAYYDPREKPWNDFLEEGLLRGPLYQVYNAVKSWRFVPVERVIGAYRVNAVVEAAAGKTDEGIVTFYGGSCAPAQLYEYHIEYLDPLARYLFVAAHELGHVVDAWTGGSPLGVSTPEGEQRATVFGSYWVECWLRLLQQSAGALPFSAEQRVCLLSIWNKAEHAMADRRHEWTLSKPDLPRIRDSDLGRVSACMTPINVEIRKEKSERR